jgi:hypothetical protein
MPPECEVSHPSQDGQDPDPEPGSWQHFVNMIPTGYSMWAKLDTP